MAKGWQLRSYFLMKRLLDMALAGAALIVLSPLMIALAIIIRLDSPGGAIFAQERVGVRVKARNGRKFWEIKPFIVYKFRTMHQSARSDIHQKFVKALIERDEQTIAAMNGKAADHTKFKLQADPRVTRVGRFLRKTSLDELPQLWNVFRGDMSLVGPRPALPYEVDLYTAKHLRRLEAQPGLTGMWQITARSQVDFEGMVDLDIAYIENQSLLKDLEIMVKTPIAVLRGKGAA
jgi:lipopolysaccharide/colanic/teichoic acid biosynthesis glycosyltransferase